MELHLLIANNVLCSLLQGCVEDSCEEQGSCVHSALPWHSHNTGYFPGSASPAPSMSPMAQVLGPRQCQLYVPITTYLLDLLDVAVVVAGRAALPGLDALVVLEQGGNLQAQSGEWPPRHIPAAQTLLPGNGTCHQLNQRHRDTC